LERLYHLTKFLQTPSEICARKEGERIGNGGIMKAWEEGNKKDLDSRGERKVRKK